MRDHPEVELLVQIGFWYLFVIAAWALGMLALALQPYRHQRAAIRAEQHPWRSVLLGVPVTILPCLLFVVLIEQRIRDGQQAVLLFLCLTASVGLSVSGRALGTRLLPARSATLTTAVGTAILGLTAVFPMIGILVVLVASSLGAGAWISPAPAPGDE